MIETKAISKLPPFAVQAAKAVEAELLAMQKAAEKTIKGNPEGFPHTVQEANELVATPISTV